jgi:hypothetical protein
MMAIHRVEEVIRAGRPGPDPTGGERKEAGAGNEAIIHTTMPTVGLDDSGCARGGRLSFARPLHCTLSAACAT